MADDLTPSPRHDLAGDVREVSLATFSALALAVLGLDPTASIVALTALRAAGGVVAGRSALRSRALGRRVSELERRVAESPLVLARVAALEDQVADVTREAAARGATADELRAAFERPDVVYLVAMARDHYAVAQFRSRLERFARVVAGRVVDPAGEFDLDLHLARAALELNDEAVEFMASIWSDVCAFANWESRPVPPVPRDKISEALSFRAGSLEVWAPHAAEPTADWLRRRAMGVRLAGDLGLLDETPTEERLEAPVTSLLSGGLQRHELRFRPVYFSLSEWGVEFMLRIDRAASTASADEARSSPASVPSDG